VLIANGEIAGRLLDARITGAHIGEIGERLRPEDGEERLDAAGGALVPGLHDHHVHLRSWAAATHSVRAGPPDVPDLAELGRRLQAAPGRGWIRAVGYHETVAGRLDRWVLDRLVPGSRPLRVQHRAGLLWILNSAAVTDLHLDQVDLPGVERDDGGTPTGRLWRLDDWLSTRVPRPHAELQTVAEHALALGITGWTDANPSVDPSSASELVAAVAALPRAPRTMVMAPPGTPPWPEVSVAVGPVKLLLDDHDLPSLDDLAASIVASHREGRNVAVHCVTAVQLWLALTAWRVAGAVAGDRVEHGAVIPTEAVAAIAELGLTVVTQPHMIAERGDTYRQEVSDEEIPDLWRLGSLRRSGISVAAGSDAPFADPDPWSAIRAAVSRRTADGHLIGPAESLDPETAIALFHGTAGQPARPRRLRRGATADLCLLRAPWDIARKELTSDVVRATIVKGQLLHRADARSPEGRSPA
jgi:predicted amidohydrolase YtcJ